MGAGTTAKPTIAYCEARKALLQDIADAVSELAALHNEHLKAIISDEPDFQGYDKRMRKATAVKEQRKRAFTIHVQEHGC
jgi:hypothetical protein